MTARALTFKMAMLIWPIPALMAGEGEGLMGFRPDTSVTGILPFDWSGHWGITHSYGFPGWGQDFRNAPVMFDGNYAHWPRRYAFPIFDSPQTIKEKSMVQSALWYRRGDFNLDELALDVQYDREGPHTSRFQALKRNFDDQYGLLGPTRFPGAGGTIQQNYRLMVSIPDNTRGEWRLSTAYFKTTDAIPFPEGQVWNKGGTRLETIQSHGIGFSRGGLRVDASAFSQRLRTRSLTEIPAWAADLIAYRFGLVFDDSLSPGAKRFLRGSAKYSAISSDELGNQSRVELSGSAGLEQQSHSHRYAIALGGVHIRRDRLALQVEGGFDRKVSSSARMFFTLHHSLHSLPFQFSGKSRLWYADSPPAMFNAVWPEPSAISQQRTIARLGLDHQSSRLAAKAGVFGAWAHPHYYFENRVITTYAMERGSSLMVMDESTDGTDGIFWRGRLNYFRQWWMEVSGLSFFENRPGWGYGVQHEAAAALSFREFLFSGRLDLRVKLWGNVWGGRRSFVWDPGLGLGYEDYRDVGELFPLDFTGVVNVRFEAVVSTLDIAFTMVNLLYAGRNLIQTLTGTEISADQLTLAATPMFPAPGRLAFLEFSWRFRD